MRKYSLTQTSQHCSQQLDGQLIGQNMFMRATIKADDGRDVPIMTMGPICFEGNINFYGKSGFTFARDFGIRYHGLPEDADASFFFARN